MKLLLEITTPIFLGGSDARTLADVVRVPSIRGQVRYWLRAVLGRRVGNNIAALKEAENNLMGHTGASSLVRFQVTEGHPLETADRYLLPHRQNKSKVPMTAFAEKQAFQLAVTPRPGLKAISDDLLAALLLWLNLGGLGKRTRRGYGSLRCLRATAPEEMVSPDRLALFTAGPGESLPNYLGRILTWLDEAVPATSAEEKPDYPILAKPNAAVLVCEPTHAQGVDAQAPDFEQAMIPFWRDFLRAGPWRDDVAYGYADRNGRRASPFHWHISQTAEGYRWVFTTFYSGSTRQHDTDSNWAKVNRLLTAVQQQTEGQLVWGQLPEVDHG